PWDRLGVFGVVEAAAAPLGDVHHELEIGVLADGDGRDCDLVLGHPTQQASKITARHLAVGQEDDVLEQRRPLEENGVRLLERRVAIGPAPGLDRRDGVMDSSLVARRPHGDVPDELGVPAHHADFVAVVEQVHHEMGGFLGELDLAKEASHLVVDLLDDRNEVGVMSWDTEFVWDSAIRPARDKQAIHHAIATIKAGGGTDGYPGLKEAYQVLYARPALLKHVILLSDGQMT